MLRAGTTAVTADKLLIFDFCAFHHTHLRTAKSAGLLSKCLFQPLTNSHTIFLFYDRFFSLMNMNAMPIPAVTPPRMMTPYPHQGNASSLGAEGICV